MPDATVPIGGLACSIFRQEIEALRAAGQITWPFHYLGSMLHMAPDRLETQLEAAWAARRPGQALVLAYGDCCAHMLDFEARPGVARTQGLNCCEIMLGRAAYRQLRAAGAFFLIPEWAHRWREIFEQELGLRGQTAQDFMREMHTRLVYLDTGLAPIPHPLLADISAYAGLPMQILPLTLEPLLASLREAGERIARHA